MTPGSSFTAIGTERAAKSLSEKKLRHRKIPMGSVLHKKPRRGTGHCLVSWLPEGSPLLQSAGHPTETGLTLPWSPELSISRNTGACPHCKTSSFLKGFCDAMNLCQVREEGISLWFDAVRQEKLHFSLPLFLLCFLKGPKC